MAAADSASTPAIELDGIVKTFGRTTALDGLSLTVGRGELVGLLGPNGAGKTTAIKLLLGLARPTRGSGRVLGAPLGDRAARAKIGYLPELFRYQPWLTAREVLALHARLAHLRGRSPRRRRSTRRSTGSGSPIARATRSAASPRACSSVSGWASRCSANRS